MEVHHHTHTPRQKWKHYFYEFLMLFLAVFCGFLSEWQLEHAIEHQREHEYIISLQEDLKSDTAVLAKSIEFWSAMHNDIGKIRNITNPVNKDSLEALYRYAALLMNFDEFKYNDRTVEQLRGAGNFRLIRKEDISLSLLGYDNFVRNELRSAQGAAKEVFMGLMSKQADLFDSRIMEAKFDQVHNGSPTDTSAGKPTRIYGTPEQWFTYYNTLFLYKAGIFYMIELQKALKLKGESLLDLFKKNMIRNKSI